MSYTRFTYGSKACTPLSGDWDGNGTTTIGVSCPESDGVLRWSLRNANNPGGANANFRYGSALCVPVTGDWDGQTVTDAAGNPNGTTIGVACPSDTSYQWSLRDYNSAGGATVARFSYGSVARAPVTGDWDGDGTTTIGAASFVKPKPPVAEPSYVCPVKGPVSFSNDYGAPRSGGRSHKGNDMFASAGTPLVAVTDGTVIKVVNYEDGDLGGIRVWIRDAEGFRYYYAHNQRNVVLLGDSVSKGQVIAYVGSTGNAAGGTPHVHFQMHEPSDGAITDLPINPYEYVSEWCKVNRL